nr:DUF2213 domain-containing protein [Pseudomonas luteola]
MNLTDSVTVSSVRRTADGYLVADARVARAGNIQEYLGSEVGKPDIPIVKVYRPPESVFHQDAMKSYAHRPMVNGHPGENVTSENWKDYAIGQTGGEVMRDGDFVRVPLVLMDAQAIKDYEAGKRELSMGYSADLVFEDGITPSGERYDAYLGPMKMNHLSLENRARGGSELHIGDRKTPTPKGGHDMADSLRTVIVDGLSVQTTDQGAQAIDKLTKHLGDAKADTQKLADAHAVALAAKDNEITKLQAALDDAKAKVLTDAQIDARVKERADLIATAKTIVDADYSGKSDAEIRKAVVVAKFGDAAIAGQPEIYVQARFDLLVEDAAKQDPVRSHFQAQDSKTNINDNGQSAYETRLTTAWK